MHRTIAAEIAAPPSRVAGIIADLGTYPAWLDLVDRVEDAPPHAEEPGPAWFVTLRARLGPWARSKRLRMVRTRLSDRAVRFERREHDGRHHSPWTLDAEIEAAGDAATRVTMHLSYGGQLWSRPLDTVLGSQVSIATQALGDYADRDPGEPLSGVDSGPT